MRKLLFILLLFVSFAGYSQNKFPSTDSLTNYINRYVQNSAVNSFTNGRMNNILIGLTQMVDTLRSAGYVDSIWIGTGDTLKYRIGSSTFVIGKVTGGGSLNLQQVTDNGSVTTNPITIMGVQLWNGGVLPTGGVVDSIFSIYKPDQDKEARFNFSLIPLGVPRSYNLPNKSGTIPLSIRLNGTTYTSNDTGSIELGSIAETDNLDSVVRRGAYTPRTFGTLDSMNVLQLDSVRAVSIFGLSTGPVNKRGTIILNSPDEGGGGAKHEISAIQQIYTKQSNILSITTPDNITGTRAIKWPDSSGNVALGVRLNGTTYMAGSNGIADVGNVGGTDSTAYSSVTAIGDTAFSLNRLNGTKDTITFQGSGGGSGGIQWTGADSLFAASMTANGEHHIEEFRGNTTGTGSNSGITGGNYFFIANGGNLIGFYEGGRNAVRIGTLSSSSAGPYIHNGWAAGTISAAYQMNSNWTVFTTSIRIPTLNDGTERYHIRVGLVSALNASPLTGGMVFTYDLSGTQTGSTATGNWQTVTANSNVRTYNQNAVNNTAVAENTWIKLQIVFNDAVVLFYVNGTLIGTHTSNLPTSSNLIPYFDIRKTNGTTARSLEIDYSAIDIKYSTPR